MDSYSSLLSPIDNFAFSQFTNSPPGDASASRDKSSAQNQPQGVPITPVPKPSNEWQELLNGQNTSQFSFNMWEDQTYVSNKATGSPWRPHVFRALSNSFLDSPLSSSSYLSSTSASPSVLSSTACSPWQTCPGLAPGEPDIQLLDELSFDLQGSLSVPQDDASAYAFNNMSLGSPITLSHEVQSDTIEPFNFMDSQPLTASTIEPSRLMSNSLGLDLSGHNNSNPAVMSSDTSQMLPPFSQIVTSPPYSKGSSSHSDTGEAPPSPPNSLHTHATSSYDAFASSGSIPSESALHDRSGRRKTSRIDYTEAAYDGDSDEDLEETVGNNLIRISKRRKATGETSPHSYSESDEDADLSEFGGRRGKKTGKCGPSKGGSAANAKRKNKRRHACPVEGCKQTFTRVTDMARHLGSVHRTHDTDANRCSFCHKAFSRDDAVLRHENDSCPMRPRKNNPRAELWV